VGKKRGGIRLSAATEKLSKRPGERRYQKKMKKLGENQGNSKSRKRECKRESVAFSQAQKEKRRT